MDIIKSKVIIGINFSIISDTSPMAVSIAIDDEILWCQRSPTQDYDLQFEKFLFPGHHRFCINLDYVPKRLSSTDPDNKLIVNLIGLQHINHDFKIYSKYKPIYSDDWVKDNASRGIISEEIIHSNYLPWAGQWWLDFQTPIYTWIHKKLSMGWLL